jgi:tetratricopeptide (TPR) repeat protein
MNSLQYLFGPVDDDYSRENLASLRASGECRTFGWSGGDVRIRSNGCVGEIPAQLLADWRPDFVVLCLGYTHIPAALWNLPIPLVGLAPDWHLLWHRYRFAIPRCDLIFTDSTGVARLGRAGYENVVRGNLFGCGRSFLERRCTERARDIDVLFVGSIHPAEQRERLPWLARLALGLGGRWRVAVRSDVRGAAYRNLLARARIVFNRSVRGECNLRTFEAAAAGALLFQEAQNREVRRFFRDRRECVFYTDLNLERLISYYLEHEDERRQLAGAAQRRVAELGFPALWSEMLGQIRGRTDALRRRACRRARRRIDPRRELLGRSWESLGCHTRPDRRSDPEPSLIADLTRAIATEPNSGQWHNALGLALARSLQRRGCFTARQIAGVVPYFQRSVQADPSCALFRLNLAEALRACGRDWAAVEQARLALQALATSPKVDRESLDAGHFPPAYDFFRVEWERAAWRHAGSAAGERRSKRRLLEWRLHALLGDLTGDISHYHHAVALRPDLWTTQADLGRTLMRSGQSAAAVLHLRRALDGNPLDATLRRELGDALCAAGDHVGRHAVTTEGRALERSARRLATPRVSYTYDGRP